MTLPKLNNIPSLKPLLVITDQDTPIKVTSTKSNKWYINNTHSDDDMTTPKKDLSFDMISSTPLFNNNNVSFSSPIKKLHNFHLNLNDDNQFHKFELYNDNDNDNNDNDNNSNNNNNGITEGGLTSINQFDDQTKVTDTTNDNALNDNDKYNLSDTQEAMLDQRHYNEETQENEGENKGAEEEEEEEELQQEELDDDEEEEEVEEELQQVEQETQQEAEDEEEEEEDEEDEYDDRFDDYYLDDGNRTIIIDEEDDVAYNLIDTPPVFVRKRNLSNISDDMEISISNTSNYSMKSNYSDSTPCPPKSKRTKLNFKNNGNLLNLSCSKKLNLEMIEDSIPISQSTPANSRAPSPPFKLPTPPKPMDNSPHSSFNSNFTPKTTTFMSSSSSSTTANYSFVSKHNYTTPITKSQPILSMKHAYNHGNFDFDKYQIIGEFPITSAGMMNESDSNVHIADKRINDIYLEDKPNIRNTENGDNCNSLIKEAYFANNKLPLLPPNFDNQINLSVSQILKLINRQNLLEFYQLINGDNKPLKDLIKLERIKWHPDKWCFKFQNSQQEFWFNMEIIQNLSQLLNALMEEFDN